MSALGTSLERTLATVLRRGVPEGALACAAAADRVLLENVGTLAQQVVPELDLTRAQVERNGDTYTLRLPWSAGDAVVTLASLREIESYAPYRILDVSVSTSAGGACMAIQLATENKPLVFTEWNVIRLKRRRG